MSDEHVAKGRAELIATRKESRSLYWMVAIFSFFVNLLMLTGPLYMLNIYDRVLSSRSFETLIALSVLVAFLYAMMGILDFVCGRIMGRVGARFQASLDRRVFGAVLKATTLNRAPREAATGLRDLEAVQRLITSPALMALFDLPWVPLFFLGIFIFHPLMGMLGPWCCFLWRCSTSLRHANRLKLQMPRASHLNNWARISVAKVKWCIHWECVGPPLTVGKSRVADRWTRRLRRPMRRERSLH